MLVALGQWADGLRSTVLRRRDTEGSAETPAGVEGVSPADGTGRLSDRQVREHQWSRRPLDSHVAHERHRAQASSGAEGTNELGTGQVNLIGQRVEGPRLGQAGVQHADGGDHVAVDDTASSCGLRYIRWP